MKNIWKLLENALRLPIRESAQYRGDTAIRLQDLQKLAVKYNKEARLNPNGGVMGIGAGHEFDPQIWTGWQSSLQAALIAAATDKGKDGNHPGAPQGGTMMKKNYGGRVSYDAGKPRTDFERQTSAMDRYDVLMVADITTRTNKNGRQIKDGLLKKLVYSPSIGSADERSARLQAILSGQDPGPAKRRAQPDVPGPSKDQETRWSDQQKRTAQADADSSEKPSIATGASPSAGYNTGQRSSSDGPSFKDRLAKHNADYEPKGPDPSRYPDVDRMFDPDDLPNSIGKLKRK